MFNFKMHELSHIATQVTVSTSDSFSKQYIISSKSPHPMIINHYQSYFFLFTSLIVIYLACLLILWKINYLLCVFMWNEITSVCAFQVIETVKVKGKKLELNWSYDVWKDLWYHSLEERKAKTISGMMMWFSLAVSSLTLCLFGVDWGKESSWKRSFGNFVLVIHWVLKRVPHLLEKHLPIYRQSVKNWRGIIFYFHFSILNYP